MDALIRQAQQGDNAAFEQLLQRCYDSMFRYAMKWSGNRENAEDITHQACLKLSRGIKQFRFESAFNSWLYRLVINCAKDWQKAQQRHAHEPENNHASQMIAGNSQQAESQIQLQQVLKQIQTMGEGYKETIVLVLGEGLTHSEAADILAVKESTISWRIHEVRKRLNPQQEGGK